MKPSRFNRFFFLTLCAATACGNAATLTWDGNSTTAPNPNGGSGTWNTSTTNWWNGSSNVAWPTTGTDNDALFANTAGTVTFGSAITANDLTFNTTGYILSGAFTLTLNGTTPTITTANGVTATIGNNTATVIAGTAGLVKTGGGTLVLNGSAVNTFTGGVTVNAGTLTLDFSNLSTPTDLLNGGNALSLSGSGTLNITGKTGAGVATSQNLGNLIVTAGGGSILIDPNNSGAGSTTLNLGTLTAAATGSSLLVGTALSAGTGTVTITTTSNKDAHDIYGGRIVFANGTADTGYDWATTASGSSPYTLSAYTGYTTMVAGATTDTLNQRVTSDLTLSGAHTHNSLKIEDPAALQTLNLGANLLTLNSGGLLVTGTNAFTISGTAGATRLTAGNGSGLYELIVHQFNSGGLTIGAVIGNNGANATGLTKTGSGSMTLSGANIYTGTTTISSGTVNAGVASVANVSGAFGNNSAVTFSNAEGAVMDITGFNTQVGSLNGGGTSGGNITLGAATLTTGGGNLGGTYSGVISGTGNLTKIGTNTQILTGINTYTGDTTITAGTLTIGGSGQLNSGTYAGNIANAATLNYNSTANQTLSGTISGGGTLRIGTGTTGTLTIDGSTSNTMGLTINGYTRTTVILAKTGGAIAVSGDISIAVGHNESYGTVSLGGDEQIADTAQVTLGGAGYAGDTKFRLLGFSETIAGLNSNNGTFVGGSTGNVTAENGSAVAGTSTLTVSGSGTYNYGPVAQDNVHLRDGSTGKLAFTKNGTGTQIFSSVGDLSYSGATTVNLGTLSIRGSTLSGSAVTLAGGTLDLQTATISKAITGTTGSVTVTGGGTSTLSAGSNHSTYSGDTTLSGSSTLTQTVANSLSANSLMNIGAGSTLNTGANLAGSVKALTGAGTVTLNTASANLTIADGFNQIFSGGIGGAGKLTKAGSGTQTITGANSYTGGTVVTGGTLISTSSLGTNSGLTLNGGIFAYRPTAAGALNVGTGVLNFPNGSRIGTAVGGNLGESAITSSVGAVTTGTVTVDVYGIPGVTPTDGSNNLITGPSGLDGATYALGNIYNATNFTVGSLSSSASAVSIITTGATALTTEYWKGGFSGGNNVWAISDGTANSNWASDVGGTATSLTPGTAATINFSASGATNQNAMTLGANMSVAGIVVSDSSSIGLNADGNTLTLGAAGITIDSGAGAVSLAAPITLSAAQTWANNSSNTLTVSGDIVNGGFLLTSGGTGNTTLSGALSGTGGLAKADAGTLVLSSVGNNYTGGTTLNAGVISVGSNSALGTGTLTLGGGAIQSSDATALTFGNAITFNTATTFGTAGTGDLTFTGAVSLSAGSKTSTIDNSLTTFSGAVTGAGGGLIKEGAGTLTLTSTGTNYSGATILDAGTLNLQGTTAYVSATTVNNGATLTVTNSALQAMNAAITLNNGATLTHNGQNAISQYWTNSQAVTVAAGAAVTLNETSLTNTTGNQKGTFLDGGLKGGGANSVVTINATNADNGFTLRDNDSTYSGKIIVNGIANGTSNLGSGLAVAGLTTGLENADLEVNGTLELGNLGLGWAGVDTATAFTMGALSGTGVVTNNNTTSARALTVGNTNLSGTFSGVLQNGAKVLALTKIGSGTQTLSGLNTYSGATTVNGGTLTLDLSTNTTGVLNSASALTLGGGTLNVQGKATGASSQTLGNLTLTANTGSTVVVNPNGGTGTTLTLGNTWTAGANSTVLFDLSAGTPTTAIVSSNPTLTNGLIGGWATVKDDTGTGFATVSAGNVVRYTSGTALASGSNSSTTNFTSTPTDPGYSAGTLTMSAGTHAVNTVALNTGTGGTLDLNAQTLTVSNNGGLLVDGAGNYAIQNGIIAGTTNVSLQKFGSGTLTISGVNTFSGGTTVHDGTLKLSGATTQLGSTSNQLTLNGGTLDLNGVNLGVSNFSGSGGTLTNSSATAATFTVGNNNVSGGGFYGAITGGAAMALTKTGTGTYTFSGSADNTYTGLTYVTGAGTGAATTGLKLAKADGVIAIQGDITLNNAGNNSLWFAPGSNNQLGGNGVLTFTGTTAHGRFMLEGTTQSIAGINNSNSNGVVQNGESQYDGGIANTGTGTLILAGSGTYAFGGYLRSQTGTLALNKTGSGTQTLSGVNITYNGATSVTGGTLKLVGTTAFASAITNSSIVEFNTSGKSSGALAGAGTFNKTGAGIFEINNGATQLITTTGQFNIQTGTLQNNNNNVNWSGNTADIDITGDGLGGGAILDLYADAIYLDALTGGGIVQNNYGNASGQSGSSSYIEKMVLGTNNGDGTFTGVIRNNATNAAFGTGGVGKGGVELWKTGTGTQTLSGTNTYSGKTTISGGTLQFAKKASLYNGAVSTANWTAANITVASGATLALNVGGTNEFASADVDTLLTNISVASSATTGLQAGARIGFDTTTATGGTFTQGNAIADSTGTNGGAIGVTKLGTGTLIFDKTNTYTGATTVSDGVFVVNGSLATGSAVSVAAKLFGNGTIGGATTILGTGTHSAGAQSAVGQQTFTTGINYNQGSIFEWNLTANTETTIGTRGTNYDAINTGSLATTGSGAIFRVVLNGGQDFSESFWNSDRTWSDIFTNVAGTSNQDIASIFSTIQYANASGVLLTSPTATQGSFTMTGTTLTWSAVPEPSSALAGLLIGAGLLRRKRRSQLDSSPA